MIAAAESIDIQKVFQAQKQKSWQLKMQSIEERKQKLQKLHDIILTYDQQICQAIHQDFRKAFQETRITEIYPVLSEIKNVIKNLSVWAKPKKVSNSLVMLGTNSYIKPESKGVALIISPWNYPFQLAISPLTYAIAAGNCAIIKPSEMTPNTSEMIKKMISEIFDSKEIAVLEGDATLSTELLKLPFDHIFFTGSPQIGKVVMRAAAEHLTSVTLELGGKSPVVVDQSANLEITAEKLVWGKFVNNGQTCVAPDYLLVHESVKDELLKKIQICIENSYNSQGKGIENSDSYCRIINQRNWQRIKNLIENALENGAKIEIGGQIDAKDNFIAPTLISEVHLEMKIMQEEIFAPVLPVIAYKNLEEAIEIIVAKEKPLAMYIFSENNENIELLLQKTSAGGTCVNDCLIHLGHHELPFGGVNNSGIGKTHGFFGFEAFSNMRAVLKQQTFYNTFKLFYPPYNFRTKKLVDKLLKWF
ncbi:MAG: aldehyde dehydrogenase family protein [Bacteroidetes bacterium]|nr:MAG: aldehyde dehydrogenase family protein [Bacteroidota bacterium]